MKIKNIFRYIALSCEQAVLAIQIIKQNYDLIQMEHEGEMLEVLNSLPPRYSVEVLAYFQGLKAPKGISHNLVYKWPKRDLIKALNNAGIAVGPVPNYRNAFLELVWKIKPNVA